MDIYKETLENGLTTFIAPRLGTQAVTVLVFSKAGSIFESKEDSGIAHFIEHTLFKGTPSRPDAFSISREFDALGADFNAYTNLEYTGYVATVRKNHVAEAMSLLGDMYLNATFPEAELEKEKGVVIEEIKMYADDPQSAVFQKHYEQVFGDQPVGRPIIGNLETVSSFTREHVVAIKNLWYGASNTAVIVTGAVDPKEAMSLLKKNFSGLAKGRPLPSPSSVSGLPAKTQLIKKESDQAHVVMSLPGVDVYDDNRNASVLLARLLGGTMSSRLFQTIREELGVAYYVNAGMSSGKNFGRFVITAGTDVLRTGEAIQAIKKVLRDVVVKGITQEELDRARESMFGHIALGLEASEAVAMFLAKEWLYFESPSTPDERIKLLKKVTLADVQSFAGKMFSEDMHISVLGPELLAEQGI